MTTPLPPQIPDDPRGWLTFAAPLPDDLQRAEDATQHADYVSSESPLSAAQRAAGMYRALESDSAGSPIRVLYRPATPTERFLLETLGYQLPEQLSTRVEYLSATMRNRRWPTLETENS